MTYIFLLLALLIIALMAGYRKFAMTMFVFTLLFAVVELVNHFNLGY